MPLVRWTPAFLDSFKEFDELFQGLSDIRTTGLYPALDIYQDDHHVYVEAPLAGVDPQDVQVAIENDILTLEGKVERKTEVEEKNYYRKEIRSGSFHRSVALPAAVVGDKAQAVFENGILKITVPKETKRTSHLIKVKVAKKKK